MYVEGVRLVPGARFTKPVNLDGGFNVGGFINYGFPLKKPKSNINLTTRLNFDRDVNLINSVQGKTDNYSIGQTVRYTMNLQEKLDLNFSSTSTYNIARVSAQEVGQQNTQNGDYFTQRLSIEPTYTTKDGWVFDSDFDFLMNRGQAEGFNQSFALWNASIAKQLFKKKQGELRLSVFDLLKQNQSISRTVADYQIVDSRTNVLQRYFLLTFTYNLRRFGGNQQQQGNNPMREMFRGGGDRGGGSRPWRN
jgi:hypothetical protein